jgi:S1-C subfamily serine protease
MLAGSSRFSCCKMSVVHRLDFSESRMTLSFHEVLPQIKPAVVGIGLLADPADPLSVVIQGTGFVVDPQGTGFVVDPRGLVMTNKHVAELLVQERDGKIGVRNAIARAVFFLERTEPRVVAGHTLERQRGAAPCPITAVSAPPGVLPTTIDYSQEPDLAVCQVDISGLGHFTANPLPSLTLADSSTVHEGEEVGVCGFPLGLRLPRGTELHQLTPIAQKGIVAAILPWAGVSNPHAFQLDIALNPGSSGSPVFRAGTGEVIGIVFATPLRPEHVKIPLPDGTTEEVSTIALPTGFGYAIPSNRYREKVQRVTKLPDIVHEG